MTAATGQTPLPLTRPDSDSGLPHWLGLATNHRRLFDALQGDWLKPPYSSAGTLLGVERYVTEPNAASTGSHPISVRLKLNATKLESPETGVGRDGPSSMSPQPENPRVRGLCFAPSPPLVRPTRRLLLARPA